MSVNTTRCEFTANRNFYGNFLREFLHENIIKLIYDVDVYSKNDVSLQTGTIISNYGEIMLSKLSMKT